MRVLHLEDDSQMRPFFFIVDIGNMLKLDIGNFKVSILFHQCGAGKEPVPKTTNAASDKKYGTIMQKKKEMAETMRPNLNMIRCNLTLL